MEDTFQYNKSACTLSIRDTGLAHAVVEAGILATDLPWFVALVVGGAHYWCAEMSDAGARTSNDGATARVELLRHVVLAEFLALAVLPRNRSDGSSEALTVMAGDWYRATE